MRNKIPAYVFQTDANYWNVNSPLADGTPAYFIAQIPQNFRNKQEAETAAHAFGLYLVGSMRELTV